MSQETNNSLSLLEPDEQGHQHSILIGKKCAYCMECGKILIEYKKKDDFYRLLRTIEDFAKQDGESV